MTPQSTAFLFLGIALALIAARFLLLFTSARGVARDAAFENYSASPFELPAPPSGWRWHLRKEWGEDYWHLSLCRGRWPFDYRIELVVRSDAIEDGHWYPAYLPTEENLLQTAERVLKQYRKCMEEDDARERARETAKSFNRHPPADLR